MSRLVPCLCLVVLGLAGCPSEEQQHARPREDFGAPTKGEPIAAGPTPPEDLSGAPPEVSRSAGHKGSIIVLWPRIVGAAADDPAANAVAGRVQGRLAELSKRAAGAREIEVRPAPETTCSPKNGCEATSVSAVVVVKGETCAVAALMAGPKKSAAHLLPWSGKVEFEKEIVGFGEKPDALVKVKEFVPCEDLLKKRENEEATLARYIFGLMPKS